MMAFRASFHIAHRLVEQTGGVMRTFSLQVIDLIPKDLQQNSSQRRGGMIDQIPTLAEKKCQELLSAEESDVNCSDAGKCQPAT